MASPAFQFKRPILPRLSRPGSAWAYLMGGGYALAAVLVAAALLLTATPPDTGSLDPAISVILTILGLNLIVILAVAGGVAWRVISLVTARSRDAGAKLHLRFAGLFALAAVVPALVVAVFFGVLVNRGVEDWFSRRVQTVVENSASVARSFLSEQSNTISDQLTVMASDLNHAAPELEAAPDEFNSFLATQASLRGFDAAYLVDHTGKVMARAESARAPAFEPPPPGAFKTADEGDISLGWVEEADLGRVLYRLRAYPDAYLYAIRRVEPGVLHQLREAEGAVVAYRDSLKNSGRIQLAFALSFIETALLVLVGSVWLGLSAAGAMSRPIGRLVHAAERVAGGDLTARVDAERDPDEIAVLSRAFNRMTGDLQAQQAALRQAGAEAEERSQFIETVLKGVSAGVIGLDAKGRLSAVNVQASALLNLDAPSAFGRPLAEVAPEFAPIAEVAGITGAIEAEVDVVRGRDSRKLRVRASRSEDGLVLTFDDITRLVAAQRNAAWRDVARRIAHEIKNPLTPIQLSAERLKRKFRKKVDEAELEVFDRCTETIVRQVGDIGRMVDEFSAFARMPAPKFAPQDAAELLRAGAFTQRVAAPDIKVELEEPVPEADITADGRMIAQALTNVFKNASEAIAARRASEPKLVGRITARLVVGETTVAFEVEDNGVGLPATDRERLTEPYVTTREKGTGLGLAIVKRILEDHGGDLVLTDAREAPGARAILSLPRLVAGAAPRVKESEASDVG